MEEMGVGDEPPPQTRYTADHLCPSPIGAMRRLSRLPPAVPLADRCLRSQRSRRLTIRRSTLSTRAQLHGTRSTQNKCERLTAANRGVRELDDSLIDNLVRERRDER